MNSIDPNLIAGAVLSELIKSFTKGATQHGLRLLNGLRERLSTDERAKRALSNLETDPADEDYQNYFSKHLRRLLEEDAAFRSQVISLLPAQNEQVISASGNAIVDSATQTSERDSGIQKIEAVDNSRITNTKQIQRRTHS